MTIKENVQIVPLDFGIAGDKTSGTLLSFTMLTGAVYHDFLRKVLPEPLQDKDLQTKIQLWFMHNNAPRFLLAVWEFLNAFLVQLIAQGGPSAWPSHFLI